MNQSLEDTLPWYKQFWPWFIIALPTTAVVASLYTVVVAFQNPVSLMSKDYYREGLAINESIALDSLASQLKLSAKINVDLEVGEVLVDLQGLSADYPALTLFLYHPVKAQWDLVLPMRHVASGRYLADLPQRIGGRWYIKVQPTDQELTNLQWRLSGELQLEETTEFSLQAK